MVSLRFMPFLVLMISLLTVKNCDSVSTAMPPSLPGLGPSYFVPAYGPGPAQQFMPSHGSAPDQHSPAPLTPWHLPAPSPNSKPAVPSSPGSDPYAPEPEPDPYPPASVPIAPAILPYPPTYVPIAPAILPYPPTCVPSAPAILPYPPAYPPSSEPPVMPYPPAYPPSSAPPPAMPYPLPPAVPHPPAYPPSSAPPPAMPYTPAYPPSSAPPAMPYPTPSAPAYPRVPAPSTPYPPAYVPTPSSEPPAPAPARPYPPPSNHRGIKAAYWPSFNDFPASSVDTQYFTHIYYAFLLPEPNTYKLDVTPFDQEKLTEFMGAIHTRNPPVKTLLSIGGGGNNRTVFSEMASTEETRAIFIESTIEVARNYGFDGVDLDWEFPGNEPDMSNLALLYQQWRTALNYEATISGKPRLLFTSAVYYASKHSLYGEPATYPSDAIAKYLDWVSPMCFDYHGKWENFTGAQSALFDHDTDFSTNYGIGSWLQSGIPPKKLVMGLPLYGRTWKLQDPSVNGIGAPAIGVGPGDGILLYNQIVDFNNNYNATVRFDWKTVSYYSYSGDAWIGYDDSLSIRIKVHFARLRALGGYFFWALGQDKDWTISEQASKAWGY